jgi:P-type Cu+ transporter
MAAHAAHSHIHPSSDTVAPAGDVKDPVCGMTIDPHTAKHRYAHDGYPYYFCSSR